jgi:hypothetical protein
MVIPTEENVRALPLNTHVEVIAGEHEGELGFVSDSTKATAQVTTGDDGIFTVRKTSLRVLATPVVFAGNIQMPMLYLPRIVAHIEHVTEVLNNANGTNAAITLQQWQSINAMICDMFE